MNYLYNTMFIYATMNKIWNITITKTANNFLELRFAQFVS